MQYLKESFEDIKNKKWQKWEAKINQNPEEAIWQINKKIQELRLIQVEMAIGSPESFWEIEQDINFLENLLTNNNLI